MSSEDLADAGLDLDDKSTGTEHSARRKKQNARRAVRSKLNLLERNARGAFNYGAGAAGAAGNSRGDAAPHGHFTRRCP